MRSVKRWHGPVIDYAPDSQSRRGLSGSGQLAAQLRCCFRGGEPEECAGLSDELMRLKRMTVTPVGSWFAPADFCARLSSGCLRSDGNRAWISEHVQLAIRSGPSGFAIWERLHPDDPAPVSQAAGYLFAEFARLNILDS